MAEYNQDRFELEIQAKEVQPPERIAVAKVFVSVLSLFYNALTWEKIFSAVPLIKHAWHCIAGRYCVTFNAYMFA